MPCGALGACGKRPRECECRRERRAHQRRRGEEANQHTGRNTQLCGGSLAQGGGGGARLEVLGAMGAAVSLEVGFMIGLIVLISCASVVFLYPLKRTKRARFLYSPASLAPARYLRLGYSGFIGRAAGVRVHIGRSARLSISYLIGGGAARSAASKSEPALTPRDASGAGATRARFPRTSETAGSAGPLES